MSYNLDQAIVDDVIRIAHENGIRKVLLFGSRARGDNLERSDVEIYPPRMIQFNFATAA